MIGMIRINSKITATADATGQSRFEKNSSHKTLPIISVFDPPKSDGITNSPKVGMNTKNEPAIIPLRDKGHVTNQNVVKREHPRSSAASSKLSSNFSNAEYIGRIINGR